MTSHGVTSHGRTESYATCKQGEGGKKKVNVVVICMHRPETQLRIGLLKEGRFTPGPHRIREGCGFESEAIHTRPLIFTLFMRAGLPGNVCVECVEETCLKLEARRAFFFGMRNPSSQSPGVDIAPLRHSLILK